MQLLNSIEQKTDKAQDLGEKYLKDTSEYYRLQFLLKSSKLLGFTAKLAIAGGLVVFSVLFLCIAGALYIGELLESYIQGFLIMGGIIFLFLFSTLLLGKSINNFMIRKLSKLL